jgi:hypothetical protein
VQLQHLFRGIQVDWSLQQMVQVLAAAAQALQVELVMDPRLA